MILGMSDIIIILIIISYKLLPLVITMRYYYHYYLCIFISYTLEDYCNCNDFA